MSVNLRNYPIITSLLVMLLLIAACASEGGSVIPGVKTGDGLFNKELLVEYSIGTASDIRFGEFDAADGEEIAIAGESGVVYLSKEGIVKGSTEFETMHCIVEVVDVEGDGIAEFMARGSWSTQGGLIDHDGNVLWTADGESATDDMDMGDVDGDGDMEFVAGYNGSGGVVLFDHNGTRLWRADGGNVWHVELHDIDGDGNDEIIHSGASGGMEVLDENGDVKSGDGMFNSSIYISGFTSARWPGVTDDYHIFSAELNEIKVSTLEQELVWTLSAPDCDDYGELRVVHAELSENQPEYICIIKNNPFNENSVLYIYSSAGTLVYEEVFSSTGLGLLAVDIDGDGLDNLLVAVEGNAWKLTPAF